MNQEAAKLEEQAHRENMLFIPTEALEMNADFDRLVSADIDGVDQDK